jgi:hypothetical protein
MCFVDLLPAPAVGPYTTITDSGFWCCQAGRGKLDGAVLSRLGGRSGSVWA